MASRIYSVVAVITDDQGRFLAVSRKEDHDDLGLPGGKVESGESPEEAIVRELYEETGLNVSRRSLRSTMIAPDEKGRLCMAFDVLQHKGVAYSREGAWVGWAEPARFLAERATYREYMRALFRHKGLTVVTPEASPSPARAEVSDATPLAPPPPISTSPRGAARQPERTLEDALFELTGIHGFPKHHITFVYGAAALSFCPTKVMPQPRVTFDQKDFAALLTEPALGIKTHQQKSLVPLNLLRYMHSLGPRCVAAVVAVSAHRPPPDWEAVASNIIECQSLQADVKLTLKKNRGAHKPVGTSAVVSAPADPVTTSSLHQPLP